MSFSYRRALKVLESWPKDANRSKNLGRILRKEINDAFPQQSRSGDVAKATNLSAFERLARNIHAEENPRTRFPLATFSGIEDKALLRQAMDDGAFEAVSDANRASLWRRFKSAVFGS